MRSHLARHVSRRLPASNGLLWACPCPLATPCSDTRSASLTASSDRCLATLPGRSKAHSPSVHTLSRPRPHSAAFTFHLARRPSRRTFFGIFKKPPRRFKEPEIEPGYDALLEFRNMETRNVRLPAKDGLLRGWRQFIRYKRENERPLNPTQAFFAVRLLRHLLSPEAEGQGETPDLGFEDLREALEATMRPPRGSTEHHLELARELYREIEHRIQSMRDEGVDEALIEATVDEKDLRGYIEILAHFGASVEASELLRKVRAELDLGDLGQKRRGTALWTSVLEGLSREGREEELLREYQWGEETGIGCYTPAVHNVMTSFYASRDQVDKTKQWFEKTVVNVKNGLKVSPLPQTYMEVVRFASRNRQQEWLQPIFEQLVNSKSKKKWWDVIFQWAVIAMDKGPHDIKHMIDTMKKLKNLAPDATTIDLLAEAALEKKDPYLAEMFIELGAELGIKPQASTLILQMNCRLDAGELGGAQVIYERLQKREAGDLGQQDLPVLNKYLRALSAAPQPNLDLILDITADVEQRHAILEPETVVSLCRVFLHADQHYEVIDTLSLHTLSYSLEERAQVRQVLVDYCLNKKTSTARAWDSYSLLRQFFGETETAERVRLMDAFFERRRPDMACQVFGHMRGHVNDDMRPTVDIYVRCLEGFGRHPDSESVHMVHNMLKMDVTVQPNTRLYNALMLAYVAIEQPATAFQFWRDIVASTEGPSYNSLTIVFWACERTRHGDLTARDIWRKITRMDLEVPPSVFAAYCGALAGHGHVGEAQRTVQGMDVAVGYGPDANLLGVIYNAFPVEQLRQQFEDWASTEYPDLWAQLESKGRTQTVSGPMFDIVRDFQA